MRQTRHASHGLVVLAVLALLTVGAGSARADNDARDYVAAPPGTFLMITYFKHISGYKYYNNDELMTKNFNLNANIAIFRPVYYTKIGPFVIDPQCLIVAGEKHADGETLFLNDPKGKEDFSASGFADPVLLATLWLINDSQSKTWLGFTPFITLPIGVYDDDRALNMGTNRWAVKPELGFVKGFGKTYIDLTAAYEFYGDNDNPDGFAKYVAGTAFNNPNPDKVEQDPLLTLEAHISHDITKSFYVALDYFYHFGGETEIDGDSVEDERNDHAAQATLGFGIGDNYQLLIQYRNEFIVESGPKTDTLGARILYAF